MLKIFNLFLGLSIASLVSGCADTEIKRSQNILKKFNCSVTSLPPNSSMIDTYNFNSMQNDKEKISAWIENYKKGMKNFNEPLDSITQKQLELFESSCKSLGGHLI